MVNVTNSRVTATAIAAAIPVQPEAVPAQVPHVAAEFVPKVKTVAPVELTRSIYWRDSYTQNTGKNAMRVLQILSLQ